MTTEEIDQLAGRDLDRQIAKVVFGHPIQDMAVYESFEDSSWQVCPLCQCQDPDFPCNIADGQFSHQIGPCMGLGDKPYWVVVPFYSTDIADAWRVVEKLTGFGTDRFPRGLTLFCDGGVLDENYDVSFRCAKYDTTAGSAVEKTMPLALCRAALRVFNQQEK